MWAAAAGALFKGLGNSGSTKKAAKEDLKSKLKLNEQEGVIGRQNSAFEMALEDYYNQRDRAAKSRGLDEFRKFSTVGNFAPEYKNDVPAIQVPTMPVHNQGAYAPAKAY